MSTCPAPIDSTQHNIPSFGVLPLLVSPVIVNSEALLQRRTVRLPSVPGFRLFCVPVLVVVSVVTVSPADTLLVVKDQTDPVAVSPHGPVATTFQKKTVLIARSPGAYDVPACPLRTSGGELVVPK